MLFSQPVAEEPFRFETELDDLPKENLKGTCIEHVYYSAAKDVMLLFSCIVL